jgi:hypothetical protein
VPVIVNPCFCLVSGSSNTAARGWFVQRELRTSPPDFLLLLQQLSPSEREAHGSQPSQGRKGLPHQQLMNARPNERPKQDLCFCSFRAPPPTFEFAAYGHGVRVGIGLPVCTNNLLAYGLCKQWCVTMRRILCVFRFLNYSLL